MSLSCKRVSASFLLRSNECWPAHSTNSAIFCCDTSKSAAMVGQYYQHTWAELVSAPKIPRRARSPDGLPRAPRNDKKVGAVLNRRSEGLRHRSEQAPFNQKFRRQARLGHAFIFIL